MKTVRGVLLAGCLVALAVLPMRAHTNLLTGLLYYDPPATLQGRLMFLYSADGYWSSNAKIYEFDLVSRSLRFLTESPGGDFDVAKDGQTFCVRYGSVNGFGLFITNAFIHSVRLQQSRVLTFQQRPAKVTFMDDHVCFHFDRHVCDYSMRTGLLNQRVSPSGRTGERGEDNPRADAADDFHPFGFRARDGSWLFFQGGDGALQGNRLVLSPVNEFDTQYEDPKGKNVRVLKRFPKLCRGSYNLDQLSPCGRYALVRRSLPSGDAWGNTYYVVNIESGQTQVLIEDKACSLPGTRISLIHWVR